VGLLNLKEDHPSAEEARRRLVEAIARARSQRRPRVLVVIHGWGSSGKGGVIRDTVRQALHAMAARAEVRGFVRGEDLGPRTEAGRRLVSAFPTLASEGGNPGITAVEP
jgi:polyphosphate kinase 2 (PPK2 family)